MSKLLRLLCPLALTCALSGAARAQTMNPTQPDDVAAPGAGIQRTMTLLANSTPRKRNRVRILFYGQSITKQSWSQKVADDLRWRFPNADLQIENRAIGGFAAQNLKAPAHHDLYPFYPDLVIFHVYGNHHDYESIIRDIRARTTAEILMQTDHVTKDAALTEESDPAKLSSANWDAWMNHVFLPQTARKYGAELADVRAGWKDYLRDNELRASQLLMDGVHLNSWGNWLMARQIEPYLRYDPTRPDQKWRELVRDYPLGRNVEWKDGRLKFEFEGNRIEAIAAPANGATGGTASVLIDGKKPSQHPELMAFTRPSVGPSNDWPAIARVSSQAPLLPETWTARITKVNADATDFSFEVFGSVTGADGSGNNREKFVSNSGRIVIEPHDWVLQRDYQLSKKSTPVGYEIRWQAIPLYSDDLQPRAIEDASREVATLLAQGLSNGRHTLELVAQGGAPPLQGLRVYQPPLHPEKQPALFAEGK